ncbi:hypothetical protein HR12_28095 [Microbacterium sp. SUBG005]|nr:hypothetical protein HR12_28095 [Microbacterium sp. SUBG005]
MLAFQTGPGRAGDDFTRLRLNIAEADFFIFFIQRQVGVVASGQFAQRFPRLHRHLTVGFRCQRKDHFGGINGRLDTRTAFRRTVELDVVQLAEELDLVLRVPRDPFPAVAELVQQGGRGR